MIQEISVDHAVRDRMGIIERGLKRGFDVVVSLLALVILSPALATIAILIAREKSGPVLFRQERIGRGGKPFRILKFRTMPVDYESDGPHLSACCSQASSPLATTLRDHHLDELPQLWNVLIGDMSIVGPRPERKYYIDQIMKNDPRYEFIYEMRPGLTSEATIYNGYTDTMEKMLIRLNMDIHYLENRSLWLDFCIIIKTVISIISGKKF